MSRKKPTAKEWIALGVIVIVACAVLLLYRTTADHQRATLGPTRIAAAGSGGWWVMSHHHLHRFNAAGERTAKIPLDRFDIDNPATALGVLGDGRVLLSEPGARGLLLCDSDAAECSPLLLHRDGQSVEPVNVGLLQGVDADRFVASDNGGRRLLLLNDRGEILGERALSEAAADPYEVPYQPRLSFDGELLIPNRKDRTILRLDSTTLAPAAEAFRVSGAPGAQRELPVDVGRTADGRWWVLNAAACLCKGEVVEFDAQARPVRRVALPGLDDPRVIALIGDRLLIADQDGARLGVYDVASGTLRALPDEAFLGEFDAIRALRAQGSRFRLPLLGVISGAPVLGILALMLLGERLPARRPPMRPAATPAPLGPGIAWIEGTPEYARRLRQHDAGTLLLVVLVGLTLVLLGPLLADALRSPANAPAHDFRLWVTVLLAILASITAFYLYAKRIRAGRRPPRIGTDGMLFYFDPGSGDSTTAPLGEVLTDGSRVLVGKVGIPLRDYQRDYYERDAVAGVILARLPREALVTERRLYLEMMRRQPLLTALVAIILVLMLASTALER